MEKRAEKIVKYNELTTEIQHMWDCKMKSDTGNNRSNWNHLKIIKKKKKKCLSNILRKHELKNLQKNSHIWYCIHTSESPNVTVQNIQQDK